MEKRKGVQPKSMLHVTGSIDKEARRDSQLSSVHVANLNACYADADTGMPVNDSINQTVKNSTIDYNDIGPLDDMSKSLKRPKPQIITQIA